MSKHKEQVMRERRPLDEYIEQVGPRNSVWFDKQLKALAEATKREVDLLREELERRGIDFR